MGLPGVVATALGLVLVVTQIRTSQSFQEKSDCASDGRYMCRNGSCIPYSLKCNGAADCFGQSDELYCDKYIIEYNPFFDVRLNDSSVMQQSTVDTPETCARLCREWTPDPNDQCVAFDISVYNSYYLCKRARKGYELVPNEEEGYVHFAPDHNFPTEDNDCESDGRYTCRRGACVPHSSKCNGAHDCYGRSDELYCGEFADSCYKYLLAP
ncbi:low-density lipoprotein receptor class A domain-containing protein 3-like [Patiria miniata]|uniref:Uncharacterized protein n=1 Tax=Patiria miniata TaxID=46514 RepID=A0A914AKZ9_PATMI|nr:low-density lipoprotein receptor class A domain-containing protein 3-like [Patiria miniata]